MSMRSAQALFPACLLALVCALALPAHADTVLYSTGFENPPFTVGSISGQDGWNVAGPGRTDVVNTLTCVGTCIADTGSQAVYVDGITAEGIWHQDSSIGTPYVDLSADIAIVLGNTQGEWVFAATGRHGLGPFLGGIEIDESGEIRGITTDPVPLGTFAKTTSLDLADLEIMSICFLDIATQTYSISINTAISWHRTWRSARPEMRLAPMVQPPSVMGSSRPPVSQVRAPIPMIPGSSTIIRSPT